MCDLSLKSENNKLLFHMMRYQKKIKGAIEDTIIDVTLPLSMLDALRCILLKSSVGVLSNDNKSAYIAIEQGHLYEDNKTSLAICLESQAAPESKLLNL